MQRAAAVLTALPFCSLLHLTCTVPAQLDVVRQDCGRLSTENNQLHEQLIREGERYEALQKEAYSSNKKLESQIAELSYWKQQAISRCVLSSWPQVRAVVDACGGCRHFTGLQVSIAWLCAGQHSTATGLQHSQRSAVNRLSVPLLLQVRCP
jgi:hypothetical protein